jgi:ABC-type antimicrobial peptide transport system permease subunit
MLVRFRPGTPASEQQAALRRMETRYENRVEPTAGFPSAFSVLREDDEPADIVNFGRVRSLPYALGAVLAAIAASSLAYLLASSVRRRRPDLAILKVLGFDSRQMRTTILWQSTIFATIVLLVAIPAGSVLGRWLYDLFARDRGVVSRPVVDVGMLVLVTVATFAVAGAIGAFAAHGAWRTSPAEALHEE